MEILLKIVTAGAEQARQAIGSISQALREQAAQIRAYNASLNSGAAAWRQLTALAATFLGAQQLRASVLAAQRADMALAQLRRTLQAAGHASDELMASLVQQSEGLQRLTGFGDDAILAVQRLLFTFRLNADEVRRLTPLVLDFAAATGRDAVDAARVLGAALKGRGEELARYGIEAGDAATLIEQLARAFGGQAEAARRALGPMAESAVLWDQLRQSMGRLIAVPLNAFVRQVNAGLESMVQWSQTMATQHPALVATLRDMAGALGTIAAHFGGPAVGIVAASLMFSAIWRGLAPLMQMIRVAVFALAGGLQALSLQMGLAAAAAGQFKLMLDGTAAAATRAAAALRLGGAAAAGLLAALSGYELGKAIGQIEIAGRTIQDRLVEVIFRAQGAWAKFLHMIGLIDEQELARRIAFVQQALQPEPPPEEPPEQAPAEPPGPALAPELERLQHTARWFAFMGRLAQTDEARLAALRGELEATREITRYRERALDAAAAASQDAEGRIIQTREFLEAERAFIEAREQELELTRQIAELEGQLAKAEEARAARASLRTFRGQLGAQLAEQFGFIIDRGQIDNLAAAARDAASVVTSTLGQAFRSISDQITQLIMGTVRWADALRNVGVAIASQLLSSVVQFFTTLAARALLTAILGQSIVAGAAASAAAAWSGPAILASIATMGSAAALGPTTVLSSLATAPMVTAAATVAGYAEGGLVPAGPRLIVVGEEGPEYVVNADATRQWLPLLEAINAGAQPAWGRQDKTQLHLILVDSRNAAREWLLSSQGEARIMDIVRRRRMEIGL
jgi:hypothetical protein